MAATTSSEWTARIENIEESIREFEQAGNGANAFYMRRLLERLYAGYRAAINAQDVDYTR